MTITFDAQDHNILAERVAALDEREGPRVGDFVAFNDGPIRRISYIWRDLSDAAVSVQTSDGGSYYLGEGYVSMSGSLYSGVPADTLILTPETRDGSVWFFHHDWSGAGRGVYATAPFRLYACPLGAPR